MNPMLFAFKKNQAGSLSFEKLEALIRLIKEHPPYQAGFLETLPFVTKMVEARGAAVYLYEAKTDVFLLKIWSGVKPGRFSLSGDYEFIKYLKLHEGHAASRQEFAQGGHELRQPALFFFQQTSATKVYPLLNRKEWLGLVTFDFAETNEKKMRISDQIVSLYLEELKSWLLFERLEEKNKKLSELGHVKDQLLANVTHELQTPLNGILGVAEAILDGGDGPVSGALRSHMELISKAGKDLSATVNNILKLTQIEAHKNEVRFEKAGILTLIDEVAMLYHQAFREKNVVCELPSENQAYDVFVEPDQIRTVLMNLIGNAVKFTANGKIAVDVRKSGEMLHVSVKDTGIGIDEDKLELIFEEFYQADGSHTRVYGGTGLGLAIVKKIVSLHGGRIWAESRLGNGAKFTFTIPLFPVG